MSYRTRLLLVGSLLTVVYVALFLLFWGRFPDLFG